MKRIVALLVAAAANLTEVGAVCSVNADCLCIDNFCQDDQFIYDETACVNGVHERCYCDVSGDEQPVCAYSRSPPDDPTTSPSVSVPTSAPTSKPSNSPSKVPSSSPSRIPSTAPSTKPTGSPSTSPTTKPTNTPSFTPRAPRTSNPSQSPSQAPTNEPSNAPSNSPSKTPSIFPTKSPTKEPSSAPTSQPSKVPTGSPVTDNPTSQPTQNPTDGEPTVNPPDSLCAQAAECSSPERNCGWGIWNVWTCQCDCAPGFCLSANQECYDGCTTTTDFNPFGGCDPRCDCPWYPDSAGGTHCVSTVNFAGIYNIHRTAEQCCQAHFSYLNQEACVQDSNDSVSISEEDTTEREARPDYYYPDIYGRDNCVYHNAYYDWMTEANSDWYLFESETDCCTKWYPARTDCPDLSEPTERDVNEKPYPVKPYFYPHQTDSNCRFGRNYPQWYAQEMYIGDHLYQTPEECCNVWYLEAGSSCPLGPDDGVQEGRYWQSDVFFYPNWQGSWCNVGNDYPEWMADPQNEDTMLFDSAVSCCEAWFSDDVLECEMNITPTVDGHPVDGEEEEPQEWYPTLAWPYDCVSDGNIPSWMIQPGYKQYYVFESKAACCSAHYCAPASSLFQ